MPPTKTKPKPTKGAKKAKAAPEPIRTPVSEGPIQPTLGGKIAELIAMRGLSISRAATMCHMTRQQLWRIIQGDVPNPGILTIQVIVIGIGCRMKDLFTDGDLVAGGIREVE